MPVLPFDEFENDIRKIIKNNLLTNNFPLNIENITFYQSRIPQG